MGLFDSTSQTTNTQNNIAQQIAGGGDESTTGRTQQGGAIGSGAANASGSGTNAVNGIIVGARGTYIDSGGVVSQDAVAASLAAAQAAIEANTAANANALEFAQYVTDAATAASTESAQAAQAALAGNGDILKAVTDLGKSNATGGQSDTNALIKTIVIAAAILGALALAAFAFTKKKP